MQCELCGSTKVPTRRALVEGVTMQVCPNCERFGKVLDTPAARAVATPGNVPQAMERRRRAQTTQDVFTADAARLELVPDFAVRIKAAREKKAWTRQDLGGRVGEREPTLARIEAGSLHPTDVVARKMEKELGIRLFEASQTGTLPAAPTRAVTLGDLLRDAARKKEP